MVQRVFDTSLVTWPGLAWLWAGWVGPLTFAARDRCMRHSTTCCDLHAPLQHNSFLDCSGRICVLSMFKLVLEGLGRGSRKALPAVKCLNC